MTGHIRGLTEREVAASKDRYGDNTLHRERSHGFWHKFFENLSDPIIKVLLFALVAQVVFTLGRCDWFETGGILAAILIATTVSTLSEYGSERAFEKIRGESETARVRVIRDGVPCEIPADALVVGDIVLLSAGERIQSDGVLIEGSLTVDQSALNGESADASKRPGTPRGDWSLTDRCLLFRGSVITGGEGVMRVGRVGAQTYYGMVAKDVQAQTRESPLKLRLSHLASQISKIGYVMAFAVALTYLFNAIVVENGFVAARILNTLRTPASLFSIFLHAFTLMITVIVVAVPEGLPMMITVVLSANTRKMLRDGVLVKKLVGIETAGSMNILFTDKTGTVTTGKLSVDRYVTLYGTYAGVRSLRKNEPLYEILNLSAKYNTDCRLGAGEVIGGNSTDRAIASAFAEEPCSGWTVQDRVPFSSDRKYSAVTLRTGNRRLTLVKGAPELLLSKTRYELREDGRRVPASRDRLLRECAEYAGGGGRVLAVTYCPDGDPGEMTFAAFMVLKDKLRPDVRASLRELNRAGIQVVMVTGDSLDTATHIAVESGIFRPAGTDIALGCDTLSRMSDEEVKDILPRLRVVARALPQDKTRLVRLAGQMGLVCGMTGDGINDAPSLKLADVGFAMGSGTDIAKSAGDIVILDNSLAAIGKTVLYGRTIFKSIRKFITFQLMMNFAACGISLVGQFIGIDKPITIVQMLWVNIIMDTLGGLAFSGEPPLPYYMYEKPKKREEPILSGEMMRSIFITGSYTLLMCIVFLKSSFFRGLFRPEMGEIYHLTAFYALFIFAGIFNCFNARCERLHILANIGKNKPFLLIMAFIAVIQTLMIYLGGSVFRTAPLLPREVFCVFCLSFSVVVFDLFRRIVSKFR